MGTHQVVEQWVGKPRHQEKKCKRRRDGHTTRATKGAHPERPRAPVGRDPLSWPRSSSWGRYRSAGCALFIQTTHELGPKPNRSTHVSPIPTQPGAHLLHAIQSRAALAVTVE